MLLCSLFLATQWKCNYFHEVMRRNEPSHKITVCKKFLILKQLIYNTCFLFHLLYQLPVVYLEIRRNVWKSCFCINYCIFKFTDQAASLLSLSRRFKSKFTSVSDVVWLKKDGFEVFLFFEKPGFQINKMYKF